MQEARPFEIEQLGEINANQSEHHIRPSGRKKYCGPRCDEILNAMGSSDLQAFA